MGRCRSSSLAGLLQPNAQLFFATKLGQLWSAGQMSAGD